MNQTERLAFLINYLINEKNELKSIEIPPEDAARKRLLRSLMNIRPPKEVSKEFLEVQDAYLQEECALKGVISLSEIPMPQPGVYLWQGDITRLSVDAIVNAANSELLGCFIPCHGCIDNAIHSAAGVGLRLECSRIMEEKLSMEKRPSMEKRLPTEERLSIKEAPSIEEMCSKTRRKAKEPTGTAKITKAYNLPCRYVLHTVGPIIYKTVTERDCELLSNCYRSCLELAAAYGLKSIAFCCISTGEFHFPNEKAAEVAIQTVQDYQRKNQNSPEVIFNVFKDIDYKIYRHLLG